jgi:hypothetical protein
LIFYLFGFAQSANDAFFALLLLYGISDMQRRDIVEEKDMCVNFVVVATY